MKILIIKTSAIGDVIQTFPTLEYLRNRFPKATLDWIVEEPIAPLLRSHPLIDNVLTIHTKQWRKKLFCKSTWKGVLQIIALVRATKYDLVFDLQGNLKSGLVTLFAKGRTKIGFDANGVREKGNLLFTSYKIRTPQHLEIRTKYLHLVQTYFCDTAPFIAQGSLLKLSFAEEQKKQEILTHLTKRPCWMISFGSKWKSKQIPERVWQELLERAKEHYSPFFLFVYGNDEEKEVAARLASPFLESLVLPPLTLPLWQNLMAEMDLVLTVDSASLHLAATANVPTFAVFGPSLASIYNPPGKKHGCLQRSCPYGKTFTPRCPVLRSCKEHPCMSNIDAEELFVTLKNHLEH